MKMCWFEMKMCWFEMKMCWFDISLCQSGYVRIIVLCCGQCILFWHDIWCQWPVTTGVTNHLGAKKTDHLQVTWRKLQSWQISPKAETNQPLTYFNHGTHNLGECHSLDQKTNGAVNWSTDQGISRASVLRPTLGPRRKVEPFWTVLFYFYQNPQSSISAEELWTAELFETDRLAISWTLKFGKIKKGEVIVAFIGAFLLGYYFVETFVAPESFNAKAKESSCGHFGPVPKQNCPFQNRNEINI